MKRMINNILLIVCILIFCVSAWKLYGYYRSYKEAKDTYSRIRQESVKKVSTNERKIEFDKLRSQNKDIVGWIYIKWTSIDYPIVQGKDSICIRILTRKKAVQEPFFWIKAVTGNSHRTTMLFMGII